MCNYLRILLLLPQVPLPVALPLAEKPHLLQPSARKEELFGRPRMEASMKLGATGGQSSSSNTMSLTRRLRTDNETREEMIRQQKEVVIADSPMSPPPSAGGSGGSNNT